MRRFFTTLLLLPVYFYKYCISPMTPASCRYTPTCSEYAVQSLEEIYKENEYFVAILGVGRHDPVP